MRSARENQRFSKWKKVKDESFHGQLVFRVGLRLRRFALGPQLLDQRDAVAGWHVQAIECG